MIPRYTHPDMGRIWSEERRYETWLQVEIAAAQVMADAGIIPQEAARDIRERGKFDVARIAAIEETTQHDVIAFTTAVAEHVGPSARWLHFGLTSSEDRKSTRLNSSHTVISYAVFCLKKKKIT